MGLPENHSIGNKEITPNITLTVWVKSLRGYLEERGLYTVFRIFDLVRNIKVYLLKDWGSTEPDRVVAWDNFVLNGIGGAPVCDYDVDDLKWTGKAIMNSIYLYLWD